MIPKIIHQIWFQGLSELPNKYLTNIEKNKSFNPGWEYKFWDETSIYDLVKQNDEWLEIYDKFIYLHQKVDFAKYIILYKYGGAYIDMDSYCIKSLDGLIEKYPNYEVIASKMNISKLESYLSCYNSICINNGIILATKASKAIKKLIMEISKSPKCRFYENQFLCIMRTTGPSIFTKILLSVPKNTIKILPPEYLEPCIANKCQITENTYVIHKHANSWIPPFLKSFFEFYMNNKTIFYSILILIVLFVIIIVVVLLS